MYVGHSLLALALGGTLARRLGLDRQPALVAAVAAAGFALVPDVDTLYTLYVVVQAGPSNVFPTPQYVWTDEAWIVHRNLTHSLLTGVLGVVVAASAGVFSNRGARSTSTTMFLGPLFLLVALSVLLATGFRFEGQLGAITMAAYGAGILGIAALASRSGLSAFAVGGAAAVGLLTHPFGDVFMGLPPAFLYPLVTERPLEKVTLIADPTVNLVVLFSIELALAWAALLVASDLSGFSVRDRLHRRAGLGVGFAGSVAFITPPTLEVAYHFAIGTIVTGAAIGLAPLSMPGRGRSDRLDVLVTSLAAVTLAVVGYLLAYLAFA